MGAELNCTFDSVRGLNCIDASLQTKFSEKPLGVTENVDNADNTVLDGGQGEIGQYLPKYIHLLIISLEKNSIKKAIFINLFL